MSTNCDILLVTEQLPSRRRPDETDGFTVESMNRNWSALKGLALNATIAVIAVACGLAIGEAVVRLFFRDDATLFPRYHTDYRYGQYLLRGIRPNAEFWHTSVDGTWKFTTNSKGFRNSAEFSYAKPEGTLRILSIGDSHTQGYEVRQDYTYSAAAERYLHTRGLSAEAINAGVSGYSTAEALAFLEAEGHRFQPDVVVLGFYANDFEDNLKAGLFALDARGQLQEKKYAHIPGVRIQNLIYSVPPVRWLSENSYLYSLVFNGVWNYFKQNLRDSAVHGAHASELEYAVPTRDGPSDGEVALAARLIERMHRFCSERDIRLIVVDIPRRSGLHDYGASLPPALRARLELAGVEILASESLLSGFRGIAEFHKPHGHQHISEFTHVLIGAELGRRMAEQASRSR